MKHLLLLAVTLYPFAAAAQVSKGTPSNPLCAMLGHMGNILREDYGEVPVFAGGLGDYAGGYSGVTIWANPEVGSWTATTTTTEGVTCVVATGPNYVTTRASEGDPT